MTFMIYLMTAMAFLQCTKLSTRTLQERTKVRHKVMKTNSSPFRTHPAVSIEQVSFEAF